MNMEEITLGTDKAKTPAERVMVHFYTNFDELNLARQGTKFTVWTRDVRHVGDIHVSFPLSWLANEQDNDGQVFLVIPGKETCALVVADDIEEDND